jgi:glycerophosphoryl diester phosphodiesterase/HEAT repeat protein
MNRVRIFLLVMAAVAIAHAQTPPPGRVELLCHRTANHDVPENTLESLDQAALLGCDVVEIDLRRTLDGKIVLNHDGFLERLTDGVGETETTYYGDLELRDAGAWMGDRFAHMHIALFEDVLRLARERKIRLILDMKTKGIGPEVLALLRQEGMLEQVRFGGEWEDVKQLYPQANAGQAAIWVQPGVSADQVNAYRHDGKKVIANFSANPHGLDLAAMKAAVAAGVDGINVDYPRLGADAVGRPVERTLAILSEKATSGDSAERAKAILELSRYRGFQLQGKFAQWLLDADDRVSRAAALSLVTARPLTPPSAFAEALRSDHADARANAAWALGMLNAPASILLPVLKDSDATVLQETLLALSRMPEEVDAPSLLPLLTHPSGAVRGAAALALARHQPDAALRAIPTQLRLEVKTARAHYEDFVKRGQPRLSKEETAQITGYFRCEMKMVQAISMLKGISATQALEEEVLLPEEDFSQMSGLVASFQLWDRLSTDPAAAEPIVQALQSNSTQVADRAEWILVQAGPAVLPEVRKVLDSNNGSARERAIRIVAWQRDTESLEQLRSLQQTDRAQASLIAWALGTIKSFKPTP